MFLKLMPYSQTITLNDKLLKYFLKNKNKTKRRSRSAV